MLRQNTDADLPGCNANNKGENDRSLILSDIKPDRSTRHQLSDRVPANTQYRQSRSALTEADLRLTQISRFLISAHARVCLAFRRQLPPRSPRFAAPFHASAKIAALAHPRNRHTRGPACCDLSTQNGRPIPQLSNLFLRSTGPVPLLCKSSTCRKCSCDSCTKSLARAAKRS